MVHWADPPVVTVGAGSAVLACVLAERLAPVRQLSLFLTLPLYCNPPFDLFS